MSEDEPDLWRGSAQTHCALTLTKHDLVEPDRTIDVYWAAYFPDPTGHILRWLQVLCVAKIIAKITAGPTIHHDSGRPFAG